VRIVLNYRKPAFWALLVVMAVVILAVWWLTNPAKLLQLPDTADVLSVRMEYFNQHESVGAVTVTNRDDIAAVLSALSGARKTLLSSVNDYPTQNDYLVVRLDQTAEMRTLCLYAEGNGYFIEEPYMGVYRSTKDTSDTIDRLYVNGAQNMPFAPASSIPQAVREYAEDYMQSDIAYYNSLDGQNIADAKITALTRLNTGTASENLDIQMWLLEYRLLPEDADKVIIAGGTSMEDGWRTEQGSTGQPLLVLVHDTEVDTWQRVGVAWTLEVMEDYQGDYCAATMALYQRFKATADATVEWEYMPARSSVFPALPIRFQVPADAVRVSVDSGRLYLHDDARTPNYIECGQEMTYPKDETVLWSPLEEDASGERISPGCTLSFETLTANAVVSSGKIMVRQSDTVPEMGIRKYALTLTGSDEGFLLIPGEGYDGGGIVTAKP
jgi:hypothetical protein